MPGKITRQLWGLDYGFSERIKSVQKHILVFTTSLRCATRICPGGISYFMLAMLIQLAPWFFIIFFNIYCIEFVHIYEGSLATNPAINSANPNEETRYRKWRGGWVNRSTDEHVWVLGGLNLSSGLSVWGLYVLPKLVWLGRGQPVFLEKCQKHARLIHSRLSCP